MLTKAFFFSSFMIFSLPYKANAWLCPLPADLVYIEIKKHELTKAFGVRHIGSYVPCRERPIIFNVHHTHLDEIEDLLRKNPHMHDGYYEIRSKYHRLEAVEKETQITYLRAEDYKYLSAMWDQKSRNSISLVDEPQFYLMLTINIILPLLTLLLPYGFRYLFPFSTVLNKKRFSLWLCLPFQFLLVPLALLMSLPPTGTLSHEFPNQWFYYTIAIEGVVLLLAIIVFTFYRLYRLKTFIDKSKLPSQFL